jgi:hypothetical protein
MSAFDPKRTSHCIVKCPLLANARPVLACLFRQHARNYHLRPIYGPISLTLARSPGFE